MSGVLTDPLEIARAALADIRIDPRGMIPQRNMPPDHVPVGFYPSKVPQEIAVRALALAAIGSGLPESPFLCSACRHLGRDRENCTTAADLIAGRTCKYGNTP